MRTRPNYNFPPTTCADVARFVAYLFAEERADQRLGRAVVHMPPTFLSVGRWKVMFMTSPRDNPKWACEFLQSHLSFLAYQEAVKPKWNVELHEDGVLIERKVESRWV